MKLKVGGKNGFPLADHDQAQIGREFLRRPLEVVVELLPLDERSQDGQVPDALFVELPGRENRLVQHDFRPFRQLETTAQQSVGLVILKGSKDG